jgi:hypothetical protein
MTHFDKTTSHTGTPAQSRLPKAGLPKVDGSTPGEWDDRAAAASRLILLATRGKEGWIPNLVSGAPAHAFARMGYVTWLISPRAFCRQLALGRNPVGIVFGPRGNREKLTPDVVRATEVLAAYARFKLKLETQDTWPLLAARPRRQRPDRWLERMKGFRRLGEVSLLDSGSSLAPAASDENGPPGASATTRDSDTGLVRNLNDQLSI